MATAVSRAGSPIIAGLSAPCADFQRETRSPQGYGPRWHGFRGSGTPHAWGNQIPLRFTPQDDSTGKVHFTRTMPQLDGSSMWPSAQTCLQKHFDATALETSKQYQATVGLPRPKTQLDIRWNNVEAHEAPEYGRDPQNRAVPVLVQRRNDMWRNNMHSRNLFRTSQATRLAAIERSLDVTMTSAKRIPTCPTDIISLTSDLSDFRLTSAQQRRVAKAKELKYTKRNFRYGSNPVIGRGDKARAAATWNAVVPCSPSDVTAWIVTSGRDNPFIDKP